MSHLDHPGPVPPFFHDPTHLLLHSQPREKNEYFFLITLIPLIVCGVSPSLSLTTCPHQGEKNPRFLLLGFVIEGKAFWSHWCALRDNFVVNSKRVGRPRPEMRLHQIRPSAQSKMGVIFRLHLPRRKVKKKKNTLSVSFWSPSVASLGRAQPWWRKSLVQRAQLRPTLVPWGFLHKWVFLPRLAGALFLGCWFLRKVGSNRKGCKHPWKAFQTVLQASCQREGPYFAFYVVLKSLQSAQLKYVASINLRADYYRANSCHVIRNTGNVQRKGCLVLLTSSFVFQVWFPGNGAR